MKKFASIFLASMLMVSMLLCSIPVSAAQNEPEKDTKGSITLQKYDSGKNVTMTDGVATDGTPVEGATFSAYRILDFDGRTYTVNGNFTGKVDVDDIVNTSAEKVGTLSYGSTTKLEAQITKLQKHIKDNTITATAEATTGDDGKATINGLDLGVYLVQETVVPTGYTVTTQAFLVAIPTWNQEANDGAGEWVYNVNATPKDEQLKVEKVMKDSNQGTDTNTTKADSYSIGDTIPYVVTVKIPDYGMSADDPTVRVIDNILIDADNGNKDNSINKYNALNVKFTDVLSKGLTLDLTSLKIKVLEKGEDGTYTETKTLAKGDTLRQLSDFSVNGKTPTKVVDTSDTAAGDYTAITSTEVDGSTKMTIDIAWLSLDGCEGKTLQLTYNAQLNNDAVAGTADTNEVTYEFTNDPQQFTATPKTNTTDTDKVYTYQMDLTKTFNGVVADGTEINASGVEFTLTVTDTDKAGDETPTQLKFVENDDGDYTVWTDEAKTPTGVTLVYVLNPSATGSLVVKGLEAGTYELQETKSLDGYTILTEPVTILVEEVKDSDYNVTAKVTANTMKFYGNTAVKADELANEDESGEFALTVNNSKNQFNLPLTGGTGLILFTVGAGVILGVAFIIIARLRKSKKEDA